MRPGDALLSIQEYVVTARMRSRLAETYPLLSTIRARIVSASAAMHTLHLGLYQRAGRRRRSRESVGYWSATLPFRDHGRVFDALVYVKGSPSAERLEQVASIFGDLDFR